MSQTLSTTWAWASVHAILEKLESMFGTVSTFNVLMQGFSVRLRAAAKLWPSMLPTLKANSIIFIHII